MNSQQEKEDNLGHEGMKRKFPARSGLKMDRSAGD